MVQNNCEKEQLRRPYKTLFRADASHSLIQQECGQPWADLIPNSSWQLPWDTVMHKTGTTKARRSYASTFVTIYG